MAAGALGAEGIHECFTGCQAHRQQAVVAQEQDALVADVGHDGFALVQAYRHALEAVIGHVADDGQRMLRPGQQAVLL